MADAGEGAGSPSPVGDLKKRIRIYSIRGGKII
jgi:hypothetical protein